MERVHKIIDWNLNQHPDRRSRVRMINVDLPE
jgi:hypothetical protein